MADGLVRFHKRRPGSCEVPTPDNNLRKRRLRKRRFVMGDLMTEVTMSTEMVQLLTPDGERREHHQFAFERAAEDLPGWLRDMVLARRFDAEATALQRHGELGLWPPVLGQEAWGRCHPRQPATDIIRIKLQLLIPQTKF